MKCLFVKAAVAGIVMSASSLAMAADQLKFGPPPEWVVPRTIPPTANAPADAPVAILLSDQQIALERGKSAIFTETAFKIQTSQGLAAGNISLPWNPATDTVTVHKLQILRGDRTIDVLDAGQTFTVLRREANLDAAMLDGRLTANIQPEGLQEGDVIVLAATVEHSDPVMKGHVEALFGAWSGVPIKSGRARLIWPRELPLNLKFSGGLSAARPKQQNGYNLVELAEQDIEPILAPKGAPPRFSIGRLGEASDFASWSDIADLMSPLYRQAAVIPSTGPLRDEVERIRKEVADPAARTERVLALVQNRVRYVALFMGEGSYVPASAESTWSRRFGDCKGKTALLLAMLHELGVDAEPVAVSSRLGDGLDQHLPMIGMFDHVLVRARIGGTSYWLDGTRTGDVRLADIRIPAFQWGLPLIPREGLVAMVQPPLTTPTTERAIAIDARGGVYTAVPVTIEEIYRGDLGIGVNSIYSQTTAAQKEELLRATAKKFFNTITVKDSSAAFDKARNEFRISVKGTAKLKWEDGWFYVPASSLAYEPDFERRPGPGQDAPFAVDYPSYTKRSVSVRLPAGFLATQKKIPAPVKETLAGVEYVRTIGMQDDVLTVGSIERALMPEISAKQASADEARLRTLNDEDVYLRLPPNYRPTEGDAAALMAEKPGSAAEYVERSWILLERGKLDEAIADTNEALSRDPKNASALANRAIAYVWKQNYEAAEKDLAAVDLIQPANPISLRARGLMAEMRGKYADAVKYYSKSLEADAGNGFALLHRGMALQAMGKTDEALRDFDDAISRNPKNDFALGTRAIAYAMRKDFVAAEADIAAALKINPASPAALNAHSYVASGKGDHKAALKVYSEAIAANPGNGQAYLERAQAYNAVGDYDHALADSEQALKIEPKSPETRLLRANIFRRQGNREAALREAESLLDMRDAAFALVTAGRIFEAYGLRRQAFEAFDQALAIRPEAYIYVNRAESRARSDHAERIADLERALLLEPDNVDALAAKARQLSLAGRHDEAVQLIEQTVKNRPDVDRLAALHAMVLHRAGRAADAQRVATAARTAAKTWSDFNRLCWSLATNGMMLESAVLDCNEAVRLNPDAGSVLDSLGLVLLRLGRLDEALAVYDKAIEKKTGSSSYMGRALVHTAKADSARAASDRAEALKIEPDVEERFAEYGLKL